jgi:hypothetical protein
LGWGYFLDAKLTLPAAAWETISTKKTDEFPTQVGWWGMQDEELERRFVDMFGDASKGTTFAKLVKYFAGQESVGLVTPNGDGAVAIRIIMLLSKDMDTDIARGVSALFEAAKDHGGEGHASLANDGTYVGESGVTVTLAKGKLTRKAIRDCWAYTEELAMQLYGDALEGFEDAPPKKKAAPKKAKKAAPKKAKKAAPKKNKKPVPKKARKPAAKAKASRPSKKARPRRTSPR